MLAEFGHDRSPGRHGVVDEHRDVEVPAGEALDDVRQVPVDLIPGGSVFAIVGGDLNDPTGFRQPEMVGGGLMGEAHGVLTAGGDAIVVGWVRRWGSGLLGGQNQGKDAESCGKNIGRGLHAGLDGAERLFSRSFGPRPAAVLKVRGKQAAIHLSDCATDQPSVNSRKIMTYQRSCHRYRRAQKVAIAILAERALDSRPVVFHVSGG